MNCKQITALLSPLTEGELSESTSAEVGRHLDRCPACSTELAALYRATLLLQNDAAMPQTPLPDLYPAFQERLVTHALPNSRDGRRARRHPWTWLLPRLAVGGIGAAALAAFTWHKLSPYTPTERILIETNHKLMGQSYDVPYAINTVRNTRDAQHHEQLSFSTVWWHNGYAYMETERQQKAVPTPRLSTVTPLREYERGYQWNTNGGVFINWTSYQKSKWIRINWIPCDPTRSENNEVKANSEEAARVILQILEEGKAAQVEVSQETEQVEEEMMHKVSIGNIKQALRTHGRYLDYTVPNSLMLWFDAKHRLRRSSEGHSTRNGEQWSSNSVITYSYAHKLEHLPPALIDISKIAPSFWIPLCLPPKRYLRGSNL